MFSVKKGHFAGILVLTTGVYLPSPGILEKLEGKSLENGNLKSDNVFSKPRLARNCYTNIDLIYPLTY